jgi:simple sugar transport system permease protein
VSATTATTADAPTLLPGLRSVLARAGSRWTAPTVMAGAALVALIVAAVAVAHHTGFGGSVPALVLSIVLVIAAVGGFVLCVTRSDQRVPSWYVIVFADLAYLTVICLAAGSAGPSVPGILIGLVVLSAPLAIGALTRGRGSLGVLDVFAAVAVLVIFQLPRVGDSTFTLSTSTDFFQIPAITVAAVPTTIVVAILLGVLAILAHLPALRTARDRLPLWVAAVFALLFLFAFLTWAAAGLRDIPVPGLLIGSLALATPLIFGSLGGVLGERAGVVNVAIDGQLLFGAFSAALVGSATHSAVVGLIAAIVAGVLVAWVLAVFALRYWVDQVIVGVVLNVLVTGLTNFFYTKIFAPNPSLNQTTKFPSLPIPGLSQIPVIGPVLFDHTIIVYIMYIAVFAVWYALYKTRWGLRVRSVGEHPQAADTVGINVNRTRFWTVSIAGAIAGIGGAYYTLDALSAFGKEMTNGAGFIALAAVIFGRWHPIRAAMAGLLFGFATNLQSTFATIGSPVPSEFLLTLPYIITIVAVAGLVGQSRAPAADGTPYIKS